jgi:hypothetical protein
VMKHSKTIGPFKVRIWQDGLPVDQLSASSWDEMKKKLRRRGLEKWS